MSECDCPMISPNEIVNGNLHKSCGGIINPSRLNEPIAKKGGKKK